MKEENIRPAQLMKKMHQSTVHDINFLLKHKKYFVKTSCPACNKKNNKYYFKKNNFKYCICKNCRTYFVNPRPDLKLLERFYKQSKVYEYFNKFIFPQTEKIRSKKIFLPRVKKIIKICKNKNMVKPKMMDVGAGYGTFLKNADKTNFFGKLLAIEPSADGAKSCRKARLKVYENILENLNVKSIGKLDLITSFEVIEHLFSPIKFLKLVKKFLKKNGLLIITCPNGEGFDIQLLKENSNSIDHEHLNYFNPESIEKLYSKAGFEVIQIFTPGMLDVDIVMNNYKKNRSKLKSKEEFLIVKYMLYDKAKFLPKNLAL